MARSYKHTPVCGLTNAHSEKEDKRIANRVLRVVVRQLLRTAGDDDELTILPVMWEVSNRRGFAKDGKHWFNLANPRNRKLMRK